MSENMQCHMNVKNSTGGTLVLAGSPLSWGKWTDNPPTNITNGQTVSFTAKGAKGSATGTQGSVQYSFPDNVTYFTISFDIPYSGSNSGNMTVNGPGAGNYSANETDSSYQNTVSFPTSGSDVTVYFSVGVPSPRDASITKAVVEKVKALSHTADRPTIDIATVARAADCGEVSAEMLVKMFNGKLVARLDEVLAVDSLPAGDRVSFVANRGLISGFDQIQTSIDFAEYTVTVLKNNVVAFDLAEATIAAMRGLLKGKEPANLDELADGLEEVKAAMFAARTAPPLTLIAGIDAVLAPIYFDPGAALAQAGSCARKTAGDDHSKYEAIASWQLNYLKGIGSTKRAGAK